VHKTLDDYLDEFDFEQPVIIWFDYTEPSTIRQQIERFSQTIGTAPDYSILRVTLNANPGSLGVENNEERRAACKELLGKFFPSDSTTEDMMRKRYGRVLLKAIKLAVEEERLSSSDRRVVWSFSTHYSDGQPMVTTTVIVVPTEDTEIEALVNGWEFHTSIDAPHILDLPALSTLERLTMERLTMEPNADLKKFMNFDLPKSDMGGDPFEIFKRFYRIYPHFSRIEL
jgi:hypothetical protein